MGRLFIDGPSHRGKNLANHFVTDFGWYMNTNENRTNPNQPSVRKGAKIIDIYNGMVTFYGDLGWSNIVGMAYHKTNVPTFLGGQQAFPEYWLGQYDESITHDKDIILDD